MGSDRPCPGSRAQGFYEEPGERRAESGGRAGGVAQGKVSGQPEGREQLLTKKVRAGGRGTRKEKEGEEGQRGGRQQRREGSTVQREQGNLFLGVAEMPISGP